MSSNPCLPGIVHKTRHTLCDKGLNVQFKRDNSYKNSFLKMYDNEYIYFTPFGSYIILPSTHSAEQCHLYTYLASNNIAVTQFQYILTISIAWKFVTN